MQTSSQINSKKMSWIVSATLLLVTLCTVVFMAFSPPTAPTAHAGVYDSFVSSARFGKDFLFAIPGAFVDTITLKSTREWYADKKENILDETLGKMFEWLTKNIAFLLSTLFLGVAVWLLDAAIALSLDSALISGLTAINDGWGLVRDVCNMFFIFILLYISLATILQATSFNWKKALGNLIIAALLINFSLFFTKVIIDVSNVFAMTFYNSMKTDVGGVDYYGPGVILQEGLGLKTTFTSIDEQEAVGSERVVLTHMTRGLIWIFGAIFQMIAGFVFFAGAFIFIKRTIAFIFLMILSPIGFVGFVLPGTKKFADIWWKAITENAVIAPVFLFMLYLVCGIVKSGTLVDISSSDKTALALAFTGESAHYTMILHFILLIGLIWGALVIAQTVSETTARGAISFAGKMTGGMLAGSATAGRQTLGRAGRMLAESDWAKRGAEKSGVKGRVGRMVLRGGDAASKSSWDVRKGKFGDPIGGTLNAVSSVGKTGSIDVGLRQKMGAGGVVAATEARGKARIEKEKRTGEMLATDKYGKIRMVTDPITGKKMAARDLHAKHLERRAENLEPNAEEPAFARDRLTSQRKYLARYGAAADKKAAEIVGKGDKESKDAIRKEEISVIEKSLEKTMGKQDFDGISKIMGGLTSDHIKDMDRKILVNPEVAIHLDVGGLKTLQKTATKVEKEQIRTTIENTANNVVVSAKQGPGTIPDDKQKQAVKRTAQWLNSARGGEEF